MKIDSMKIDNKIEKLILQQAFILQEYYNNLDDLLLEKKKVKYLEEQLLSDDSGFGHWLLQTRQYQKLSGKNWEKDCSNSVKQNKRSKLKEGKIITVTDHQENQQSQYQLAQYSNKVVSETEDDLFSFKDGCRK